MNNKTRPGRLFGTIHVADIFWLLLIAALIFGGIRLSVPREVSAQSGDATIQYTIELGERWDGNARRVIQTGFHENIRIGEPIFDSLRGVRIGTIVDVYTRPFQVDAFDEATGTIRRADVDGLEFVYIIVEAHAQISDYEVLIGSFPVSVGREAYVRSKYFAGAGYIVAVER
ncbi:MAG: DUF4330 domain-containing protein [Defluviitaleaceae bacterium]|nr:DUF4330 domain-containing protein [Defluviitaleaceae bacterium]